MNPFKPESTPIGIGKLHKINQPRLTRLLTTVPLIMTVSSLLTLFAQLIHSCCLSNPVKGAEVLSVTDGLLQRGAALCALRGLLAHWRTAAWQQQDKEGVPTSVQEGGGGGMRLCKLTPV